MKTKNILISLAAFGLLLSGLVGCGNKPSEGPAPSSKPDETSQKSEDSSTSKDPTPSASDPASSDPAPSSSEPEPVHEHVYAQVGETVKNADDKDVKLYECEAKDSKYIGIAFADYSEKSADFGDQSGYSSVPEAIRNASFLMAKQSSVTWKIDVDQAIENAKIAFCMVATSSADEHMTATLPNRYSASVNGAELAPWDFPSGTTYSDVGLNPNKQIYLEVLTANLKRGENTITLYQGNGGYRLLFGGEVRVYFEGDAKPVTPFPGYNATFTVEHCKVFVYSTKAYDTETPVETLTCKAKDETGAIVAYDPDDQLPQPQVSFKVVCDEGYSVTNDNITITPRENYKNLKQNPDSNEGQDDIFRITKIEGDININIVPVAGEQAKGYKVQFLTTHCSVKVYIGPKNTEGTNLDTPEDGYYYARIKEEPYSIGRTTPQINFEVVCDEGYEFVPVIDENSHVDFIVGTYNKFQVKNGVYNMTKIESDLVITITATLIGA